MMDQASIIERLNEINEILDTMDREVSIKKVELQVERAMLIDKLDGEIQR